jgi:hypothetical protein
MEKRLKRTTTLLGFAAQALSQFAADAKSIQDVTNGMESSFPYPMNLFSLSQKHLACFSMQLNAFSALSFSED